MGSFPDSEWCASIHQRLLGQDPTAPSDLVSAFLGPLVETLRRDARAPDQAFFLDAATDALLAYAKEPSKFAPDKRGLKGYLKMAAKGDLLNAIARHNRRRRWERSVEDVELAARGGNKALGPGGLRRVKDRPDTPMQEAELLSLVERALPHGTDRDIAELIRNGERSTAVFARVLGIADRPEAEQRKLVKRNKDRIKKRLERLGAQVNEEDG